MEQMDKLLGDARRLSEFISAVSPKVWAIYVRNAQIEGYISLLVLTIFISMLLFGIWCLTKEPGWALDNDGDNPLGAIATILGFVGTLVGSVAFVHTGLRQIILPEYFALQSILDMLLGQ